MTRWFLPEGLYEYLPPEAEQIETNRRKIIDMFNTWGYQLVMPPLVEFTESLLSGAGTDLDSVTAKLTDPYSGKSMGIRADITPQIARIDSSCLSHNKINRLCYCESLLRMYGDHTHQNRSPLQVGAEYYGDISLNADIEVVSMMLTMLEQTLFLDKITLDLGHLGLLNAILSASKISSKKRQQLMDVMHMNSYDDLSIWLEQANLEALVSDNLLQLSQLYGRIDILDQTKKLQDINGQIAICVSELRLFCAHISNLHPQVSIFFDLGEVRGYNYHSGIIFAAYRDGSKEVLANGGRYDNIGQADGNKRAATGFSADLHLLSQHLLTQLNEETIAPQSIYAEPLPVDSALFSEQCQEIKTLRNQGQTVIVTKTPPKQVKRRLIHDITWKVIPFHSH